MQQARRGQCDNEVVSGNYDWKNDCSKYKLFLILVILGDPVADRGGKGKSKRAKENGDEERHSRVTTWCRHSYSGPV